VTGVAGFPARGLTASSHHPSFRASLPGIASESLSAGTPSVAGVGRRLDDLIIGKHSAQLEDFAD